MAREGTLEVLRRAARPLREESPRVGVPRVGAPRVGAPRAEASRAGSLRDDSAAYDELVRRAGSARVVLIGEATHGTLEFYRERAAITRRLIEEQGFGAVAIEGDWPDAHRVHRFVRGDCHDDADARAADALRGFCRFPSWMWRNEEVKEFVSWLRSRAILRRSPTVGFHGLDLYSLYSSAEAVVRYLDRLDPKAAARARHRYGCFEHFGDDSLAYGHAASFDLERSCEDLVVAQLHEMRDRYASSMSVRSRERRDVKRAADELFFAERNAEVVHKAEEYYRTMFQDRVSAWNLRDQHMRETLAALLEHMERRDGEPSKVVVWAHNSHVGDARATELGRRGEWTLGQLARERYGADCYSIGFSTHTGTVTAASRWGGAAERARVHPSRTDSYEWLFHELSLATGWGRFLIYPPDPELSDVLGEPRLQRAIGVIYRPDTERVSHYFEATLARQFDAMIHIDETRAVEPLERSGAWRGGEVPRTFPSAL